MSVAALSRLPRASAVSLAGARTAHLLAGIVAIGFLGRLFGAWTRATPTFFPDEYLYAELGRSIADGNLPLVRGISSGFPSLLHPLLSAPFWLFDDVESAYRAIQAFDAAVMSLAALPAYAIARQVGIGRTLALVLAAAALLGPDLLLSGWLVAEPIAYPLVLASIWATIRAIDRPGVSSQLSLLALLGLTALARVQLAVVAVVALATIVLVGARERRLRHALREQWLVLAAAGALLVLGAVLLISGRLGVYSGIVKLDLNVPGILGWAAPTSLLIVYAAGWFVVPGALVGLAGGLVRPAKRTEIVFAAFSLLLALALIAEAGFISESITGDLHERYVFYLVPLVLLWFGVWLTRGAGGRRWHLVLTLGLASLAVWVPVSRFSAGRGKTDSAFLRAVGGLEDALTNPGTAAAIIAAVCLVGSILTVLAHRGGVAGMRVVLAGALVFAVASSALASSFDRDNALRVQRDFVGPAGSWVDRLDAKNATLLWGRGGRPASAHEALFWNRSITRVALMPDGDLFDNFSVVGHEIEADGTLSSPQGPLSGWVVVDRFTMSPTFSTGVELGGTADLGLFRFDGEPARFATLFEGRSADGYLGASGTLNVWPQPGEARVSGLVTFTLTAPDDGRERTLTLETGEQFALAAGTSRTVVLEACASSGRWQVDFTAAPARGQGTRTVTFESTQLEFESSQSACG